MFRSFHTSTYGDLILEYTARGILQSFYQRTTSHPHQRTERSSFCPSGPPTRGPGSQRQGEQSSCWASPMSVPVSSTACTLSRRRQWSSSQLSGGCTSPVPEIIDPVFAKTSQNARFLLSEYERFGLVFTKTRVYKFGHRRAGQCRTYPWPAVLDWTLMLEYRCRCRCPYRSSTDSFTTTSYCNSKAPPIIHLHV